MESVSWHLNLRVRIPCSLQLHLRKRRPTKKGLEGLIRSVLRVYPAFCIGRIGGILLSVPYLVQEQILNPGQRGPLLGSQILGNRRERQRGIHPPYFGVSGRSDTDRCGAT